MKTLYKNLKVSACSKNIISNANTVFYYIDSDFRNWNLDKESSERNAEMFAVLEMDKNATFKEIFKNRNNLIKIRMKTLNKQSRIFYND